MRRGYPPTQNGWPGQSSFETAPAGQCQPEASHTGEVVTSFVHAPTQQVNPGLSSHGFPGVPASMGNPRGP